MAKILLIEDDQAYRETLEIVLRDQGHEVTGAGTGDAGIEQANAGDFDLVITDMVMPETGGLQVASAIKAKFPDMAVIGITGNWRRSYAYYQECAEFSGIDEFLAKPVSIQTLTESIDRIVNRDAASS